MLQVTCECGKQFNVPEAHAGKRGRCACGQVLRIPGAVSPETASLAGLQEETFTPDGRRADVSSGLRAQQHLGQFVLVRKLGEGAMGHVWLARDSQLDREVAIKLLPDELRSDVERLRRFQREAKLTARLDHPNTVRVHHLSDDGKLLYLVMEYVRGGSLADLVRGSGPLSWPEATRVIHDAAAGLAEAHRLGLVHRDIKPANLLRTPEGVTKVADFGLARELYAGTQLTQHGSFLGTPSYMAPEQWAGKIADARSDIYALICTYYFLLTGKPPFEADSWPALGYQHRHAVFPDPRRCVQQIPDGVCRVLQRASEKEPEGRYQTAGELLGDLYQLLAGQSPSVANSAQKVPARAHLVVREGLRARPDNLASRNWPKAENYLRQHTVVVAFAVVGMSVLSVVTLAWFIRTPQVVNSRGAYTSSLATAGNAASAEVPPQSATNSPATASANSVINDDKYETGRYLCFVKDLWEPGVKLLAKGAHDEIRIAAEKEIGNPTDISRQIEVGLAWSKAADTAPNDDKWHCVRRARFWFSKILAEPESEADLSARALAMKQLDVLPKLHVELRIELITYHIETIVISRDKIEWTSQDGCGPNTITNVATGTNLASFTAQYGRSETHRFSAEETRSVLPEGVDLTTAKLRINSRSGKTGGASNAIIDNDQSDQSRLTVRTLEWDYKNKRPQIYQGDYHMVFTLSFGE